MMNKNLLTNNKISRQALIKMGFTLFKGLFLVLFFISPWYINSPEDGRLLAIEQGASCYDLMKVYFFGTESLNPTMLSISTASIITLCIIIVVITSIISCVMTIRKNKNIASTLSVIFAVLFFIGVIGSQFCWPIIMPWLCYGGSSSSGSTSFSQGANPSFSITYWALLFFVILTIAELIIVKNSKDNNNGKPADSSKQIDKDRNKKPLKLCLIIGIVFVLIGISGYLFFGGFSAGEYSIIESKDNVESKKENSKKNNDETLEDGRNQWYGTDYFIGTVSNMADAVDSLGFISASLGEKIELDGESESECGGMHFYNIIQEYDGIEVYGRSAIVVTNENNVVVGASSNCIALGGLSKDESMSGNEARQNAIKRIAQSEKCDEENIKIHNYDKVVYSIECEPSVCWDYTVTIETENRTEYINVFVDIDSGEIREILKSEPRSFGTERTTAIGQKNAKYTLNTCNYDGVSCLRDMERNINVHALNYNTYFSVNSSRGSVMNDWPMDEDELALISSKSSVDALGNISNVYDFYKNVLDWRGYDGRNGLLEVYTEVDTDSANAFWYRDDENRINNIVFIGKEDNVQYSCYLDIVAHEYTHAVTSYTSGLQHVSGTSFAAINEAFSDIMGETVEKYATSRCDWVLGGSTRFARDFKDEKSFKLGEDGHDNAEYIDHIAYLIGNGQTDVLGYSKEETRFFDANESERGDLEAYAKFWFRVQSAVPSTVSLDQLATVSANIAKSMWKNNEITKAQYKGILKAFKRYGLDTNRVVNKKENNENIASSVVLAIDVSGSMNDKTTATDESEDVTKLDIAKESANTLIEQIDKISNKYRDEFTLGVASFADNSSVNAVLSVDMLYEKVAINSLSAKGGTDIYKGLNGALQLLSGIDGSKSIILLSDGEDTASNTDEEIISLAEEISKEGVVVYTIGFGDKGKLNESLLENIAKTTGGKYKWASSDEAISLVAGLLHAQADSIGDVLYEEEGKLAQGETSKTKQFEVGNDTGDMSALLYWPGSDMETILIDPDGKKVTDGYQGAEIDNSTIPSEIVVKDPEPGKWSIAVFAEDTSQKKEPYYSLVSFRQFDRISTEKIGFVQRIVAIILPVGIILIVFSIVMLLFRKDEY